MGETLSNHKIYNLTLTNANTEYSQVIVTAPKYISVKCRNTAADIKLTLVATESGTVFTTIFGGSEWNTKGSIVGVVTLYLQSPTPNVIAEIESWH